MRFFCPHRTADFGWLRLYRLLVAPLTEDQMKSAIEYLRPIIKKYNIPYSNIVTHEMVRQAYKKKHPQKRCSGKVDITQTEYKRFMKLLRIVYDEK